jgi:hypothetical protein
MFAFTSMLTSLISHLYWPINWDNASSFVNLEEVATFTHSCGTPSGERFVVARRLIGIFTSWLALVSTFGKIWIAQLVLTTLRARARHFFCITSRTAMMPSQPHIQWVPKAFSQQAKLLGRKAVNSLPSRVEVRRISPFLHTSLWRLD